MGLLMVVEVEEGAPNMEDIFDPPILEPKERVEAEAVGRAEVGAPRPANMSEVDGADEKEEMDGEGPPPRGGRLGSGAEGLPKPEQANNQTKLNRTRH